MAMASPTTESPVNFKPLRRANTVAIQTKSGTDSPLYASLISEIPSNALVRSAALFSKSYMSNQAQFDSSHDFNHILSVLAMALEILKVENARREQQGLHLLNKKIIVLGSLLHDVDDKKYPPVLNGRNPGGPADIYELMLSWHADEQLASLVSRLCAGVSYTSEISNPAVTAELITKIPELAVVQDADRLDALGAVGIGRCFFYGGAHGRNMGGCVGHFVEKLFKLERMMKTETGRALAKERTKRLKEFMGWWKEETSIVPVSEGV
jgi:uncharacterized protein